MHLGIRRMLKKIREFKSDSGKENQALGVLPVDLDQITRLELSLLGPKILNNVGIIGRKSKLK